MRSAECGMRNCNEGSFDARRLHLHSAFRIPHSAFFAGLNFLLAPSLSSPQALPPLPDTTGFGVHVLAIARAPDKAIWVGSYGQGVFVLRPGAASWAEITDSAGATTAQRVWGRIRNQYVLALAAGRDGALWAAHLRGLARSRDGGRTWSEFPAPARVRALAPDSGGIVWVGTERGLYRLDPRPRPPSPAPLHGEGGTGGVAWLDKKGRPACAVAPVVKGCRVDMPPIEALERVAPGRVYAATRQGAYEQDGGSLNLCDPLPAATAFLSLVPAVGNGVVVFAGPAEQGAHPIAIRHDRKLKGLFVYSVYYHNTALVSSLGQRVKAGDVIATVGNTGRATNDHLHLEVHAAPVDSVPLIVDPNERYPRYSVNPELWIRPLPGTGIVAGQVWDAQGQPVPQARVYGLIKAEPQETPFSYAETYGEHNHPDPAYREHFAVSDVEPGDYTLAVLVDGKRLTRRIRVEAGRVTWVVFGSGAH